MGCDPRYSRIHLVGNPVLGDAPVLGRVVEKYVLEGWWVLVYPHPDKTGQPASGAYPESNLMTAEQVTQFNLDRLGDQL